MSVKGQLAMVVLEVWSAAWAGHSSGRGGQRLRLLPHAHEPRTSGSIRRASPSCFAVLFRYFPAHPRSPVDNVPGQSVFTCLSYDMITHEVFKFRATGHTRDGEPVSRETVRSKYVEGYATDPPTDECCERLLERFKRLAEVFEEFLHRRGSG
jgi:hypothetical protein